MRYIQINFVGILSSKEEINEIENIAAVFLIEERVIDLAPRTETRNGKLYLEPTKKQNIISDDSERRLQFLTVKGLN